MNMISVKDGQCIGTELRMNFKDDTCIIWAMLMEYFPHCTDAVTHHLQ